jgi:hypothetical protein
VSITNPTLTDLGSKPDLRSNSYDTNRLSRTRPGSSSSSIGSSSRGGGSSISMSSSSSGVGSISVSSSSSGGGDSGGKGTVVPVHAMKAHRANGVRLHSFLTTALVRGEWSATRHGRFTPREESPGYPLEFRRYSCSVVEGRLS